MDRSKPFHERVAEKIIELLEAGTAPWQKPWEPGRSGAGVPMNPVSGKRYKGINAIFLAAQGYSDPRWMTYKQAQAHGAQVRKGEQGTPVQYWKFSEAQPKLDTNGQPVIGADGKPETVHVQLERPRVFHATVFNAEQIDGLSTLQLQPPAWDAAERAEKLLLSSGATIRHVEGDRAFYRPSTDSIQMPEKGQFPDGASYYAVALHELGHWTGHENRLGRDLSHPFGSEGYAREELRAEIASMLVGDALGIGHDTGRHASYVAAWIKVLKEDPLEIFRAAADAERIHTFVMAFDQHQLLKQEASVDTVAQENQRIDTSLEQAQQPRVYVAVPFAEKDQAKALGARWDRQEQSWYVPPGVEAAPLLARWPQREDPAPQTQAAPAQQPVATAHEEPRTYLAVPYIERHQAKAAGARWDGAAKSWYAGEGADMGVLQKWLPENQRQQQDPAMGARDEFAQELRGMGFILEGEHPIMDGATHRVAAAGDKGKEKAGFYVAHLDGHMPAGYAKNNRTGQELRWKAKGYNFSDEDRARLTAEATTRRAEREAEQQRQHEAAAQRVQRQLAALQPVDPKHSTPYLQAKGVRAYPGLFTDHAGKTTFVPAYDKSGMQWTTQYIGDDGTKRFAKDSRKEGCFHVLGGMKELERAPVIVVGEGYATMATLKEAMGAPVAGVVAFDSGNVGAVAKALRELHPTKPILVAGDDDRAVQLTQGFNPGREKAEAAARDVGGRAFFPIFAPGEADYPRELAPITPAAWRLHGTAERLLAQGGLSDKDRVVAEKDLLKPEQLAALARMKSHTDFNDLAQRSQLGREGLLRQVMPEAQQAVELHKARVQEQSLAQVQQRGQDQSRSTGHGMQQRQRHGMRAG
jgi:antirestriction protein ArdC/phage/plasmid primase-like uncharacterized protein